MFLADRTIVTPAASNYDEDHIGLAEEKTTLTPSSFAGESRVRARARAIDVSLVLINTACTVVLVFLNKIIFENGQLRRMPMSFAMWHFSCTAFVLWIACHKPFHLFEPIRLPFLRMIPLCAIFTGFLVLNNLSLARNSVGFYQLAKILTTPTVVLLNYLVFHKTITSVMAVSLCSVCCGVALVTGKNMKSNINGTTIAALACVITALYQVWIGKKMQDFKVSSPQLLMNQAMIGAMLLGVLSPFFDTMADAHAVPPTIRVAFFLSGFLASLLNLSHFLIIGRMSALTFNVTSYLTTIIIVSTGWIQEGKILAMQDRIGVVLAVGGVAYYTHLSRR